MRHHRPVYRVAIFLTAPPDRRATEVPLTLSLWPVSFLVAAACQSRSFVPCVLSGIQTRVNLIDDKIDKIMELVVTGTSPFTLLIHFSIWVGPLALG